MPNRFSGEPIPMAPPRGVHPPSLRVSDGPVWMAHEGRFQLVRVVVPDVVIGGERREIPNTSTWLTLATERPMHFMREEHLFLRFFMNLAMEITRGRVNPGNRTRRARSAARSFWSRLAHDGRITRSRAATIIRYAREMRAGSRPVPTYSDGSYLPLGQTSNVPPDDGVLRAVEMLSARIAAEGGR